MDIRIAFDGKRAVNNDTGLGNYSRLVIASMSALYPQYRYLLFAPKMRDNPRLEPLLLRENVEVVLPSCAMGRHFSAFWRSVLIPREASARKVDVYHGLSNEIPLVKMPCPTVVTIHDLIWRRVPEDYPATDRWIYEHKYRHSARRAVRIIAGSECTKSDIVRDWHIDPQRIDVIYQGCDPIFAKGIDAAERQRVKAKYDLPQDYIISVGSVRRRKNQLLAVRALAALPENVHLLIVGSADKQYGAVIEAEVERLRLVNRVRRLTGADFADLPALYACARFSSYTSYYEGFGIPVVESLTVGTPVIAACGSCLEEAGGGGAIYVNPDDEEGYVQAARTLLEQPYKRDSLAQEGRRHVRKFTAQSFASAIMATYNKAIFDYSLNKL